MPTCSRKKSSVPLHSSFSENCGHDRGYDGYYRFNKDQFYEGEFFRDSTHGQGTYKWNNFAVYEGGFYSNFKEGYASLSFTDCSYFEGLFIKNQPFGPGILTHANGRQDAGFWLGRKLVRLSRAVDFIIPRLAPTSAAKIKLLQFRRLIPLYEDDSDSAVNILKKYGCLTEHITSPYSNLIYDPRSIFFEKELFEKAYFLNEELSKTLMSSPMDWDDGVKQSGDFRQEVVEEEEENLIKVPSHCLCSQNVFEMHFQNLEEIDICERKSTEGEYEMGILAYFTKYGTIEGLGNVLEDIESEAYALDENISAKEEAEEPQKDKSKLKIVSWNRSELCTEMLKQIFRYRAFEEKLNFNLAKLMLGVRTAFRRTGEKEKQCLQFLKLCSIGPAHAVKDLLCNYDISEELMDARGNNSLMFAAAADQHDIMDILLDFGVDVNTFNDESLTPLNLCLLRRLAQTNNIYNWETAFLPQEIDRPLISDEYNDAEELENTQSITSLDRIFGDGMSISDSKSYLLAQKFSKPSSLKCEWRGLNDSSVYQDLDEKKEFSDISQITICKIAKSQGSYSLFLPSLDDKIRGPLKSTSTCLPTESGELGRPLGSSERTPKMNIHMIPKSIKRDEYEKSIQKSPTDKYLFEISFEKKPVVTQDKEGSKKSGKAKTSKPPKEEPKVLEPVEEKEELNPDIIKRIEDIDKTIKKLLKRGADPNISEVPKPSIHLGVYTKDAKTVHTLLLHGANPNCQLYSNEGLLTPLHVIVLQKPAQEYVDICDLLLKYGANPEQETVPEFSLCEEEKEFLVSDHGRTPLQLLCMRPDLEYADPNDYLLKIGIMLAKVASKRHFYKGHSCLTLAMHFGNLKLLKALLDSKFFDPNDILEEDRGTSLHVLVSTELQKKTLYDTSIKMCDLLIAGGANPLKKLKSPEKLVGTCVDYGYREIEEEKNNRKVITTDKKSQKASREKSKKVVLRDYLKDQERVVEYLGGIAAEMAKQKSPKKRSSTGDKGQGSKSQNFLKMESETVQYSSRASEKPGKGANGKTKQESKGEKENARGKEKTEKETAEEGKKNKGKKEKADSEEDKTEKEKKGKEKGNDEEAGGRKSREKIKHLEKNTEKETKKGAREKGKDAEKGRRKKSAEKETKKGAREKGKDAKKGRRKKSAEKETKKGAREKGKDAKKGRGKKSAGKETRKPDLSLGKAAKRNLNLQLGTHSETFPEKLRQSLLVIYGNCANIDINEFLVPYVVLRNGELYYRFQGKTDQKEQYSLI